MTRRIIMALTLLCAAPAYAQTPLEEYRRHFADGSRAWAEGDFVAAHQAFVRAHAILPSARSYRALGLVLYELRNYTDAVENLRRALSDERRPLSDELRADPERVLQEAAICVGQFRIVTETTATIQVDGEPRGLTRLVVLGPGPHEIELSAGGFRTRHQHIDVQGGEDVTLTLQLERMEVETPEETTQPEDTTQPEAPRPMRSIGIATIAVGGAALASGVLAHLLVRDAKDAYSQSVELGGCMARVDGAVPDTETRSACTRFRDRWQRSRVDVRGLRARRRAPDDGRDPPRHRIAQRRR